MLTFYFSLLMGAGAFASPVSLPHNMTAEKLSDDAFMITDVDYHSSNVLVVKMADGTAVIASSPFENVGTETLMEWIQKTYKPRRIVAINTHFHQDGSGGNEVYKKFGVETWSSQLTRKLQNEKLANLLQRSANDFKAKPELYARLLKSRVVNAENIFDEKAGKSFDFSGEKVEVFYPGPAHSPDNVVVYFPKQKILFGGCMIKPEELGFLGDANVNAWPGSARALKRFDAKTVVRGHGPIGGPDFIDRTIAVAEKAVKHPSRK